MVYNITAMQNATTLAAMAQGTNVVLGGYYFGYMVLMIIFIVPFLALKTKGFVAPICLAVSCWLTTLTALFLRPLMLIDNYAFWVCILLTPISVAILFFSGNVD